MPSQSRYSFGHRVSSKPPDSSRRSFLSGEFELIRRLAEAQRHHRADTLVGIGDDAALLAPRGDTLSEVATGTAAVHDPKAFGYHALATPLTRLIARGAHPAWITLSLSLPGPDVNSAPNWADEFATSFLGLANCHALELVGGDTTRGAFGATVGVHGPVLPRDGVMKLQAGQILYVSAERTPPRGGPLAIQALTDGNAWPAAGAVAVVRGFAQDFYDWLTPYGLGAMLYSHCRPGSDDAWASGPHYVHGVAVPPTAPTPNPPWRSVGELTPRSGLRWQEESHPWWPR